MCGVIFVDQRSVHVCGSQCVDVYHVIVYNQKMTLYIELNESEKCQIIMDLLFFRIIVIRVYE